MEHKDNTDNTAQQGIFIEGHRGYCAQYPENTLVSYLAALELGVDAFEFDIWLSRDKVPVLMHDGNALRTCGVDRHLRDMTLAEIRKLDAGRKFDARFTGTPVPTLEEMLRMVQALRPDFRLGVEIKEYTEETVDIAVELLQRYGFFDRCWFYCFHAPVLRYLKTRYGARTMGYPQRFMSGFEPDSYRFYDEIGIDARLMGTPELETYRAMGLPMHIYCCDTAEAVRRAIACGASLITANDPKPLLEILRGRTF